MILFENILLKNNIRPTAMRLLVLRFLMSENKAISLNYLEKHFEKSDRTTLFRTLKTFLKNGLVHKIDDGTGIAKYALCEENCTCEHEPYLHAHFHCKICKKTECLPNYKTPKVSIPKNYTAQQISLVVKGICGKCNSN